MKDNLDRYKGWVTGWLKMPDNLDCIYFVPNANSMSAIFRKEAQISSVYRFTPSSRQVTMFSIDRDIVVERSECLYNEESFYETFKEVTKYLESIPKLGVMIFKPHSRNYLIEAIKHQIGQTT